MISDGAKRLNLQIETLPNGIYELVDLFTTQDGSWEPSSAPYSVPQWALKYLPGFSSAGAATHAFARVEDERGAAIAVDVRYQAGGLIDFVATDEKPEMWSNHQINGSYNPIAGERGSWSMYPALSAAQRISGIGLPGNYHVSVFAVWRKVSPITVPPEVGYVTIKRAEVTATLRELDRLRSDVAAWLR